MKSKLLYLFSISILFTATAYAQGKYEIGTIFDVAISKKINDQWTFYLDPELREVFYKGTSGDQTNSEAIFQNELMDFTAYLERNQKKNHKWSVGYTFRLKERKDFVNRFIQIYQISQKKPKYRLTHYFRLDETVANSEDFILRFHYRYGAKIPFYKKNEEQSKFYGLFRNQFVNTIVGPKYNLELRWLLAIGYEIGPNNNVYAGFDYRVDQFINTGGSSLSRYWLKLNWSISI